jgi:hypothetical protein
MHHQRCVCPRCGVTLRVKDRTYLGRPVPCPECQTRLILQAVDDERLEVVVAEEPALTTTLAAHAPRPAQRLSQRFREWSTNVTVVSWAATLFIAALIATAALWPKRPPPPRIAQQRTENSAAISGEPERSGTADTEPDEFGVPEPAPPTQSDNVRPPGDQTEPGPSDPAAGSSPVVDQDEPLDALLLPETPAVAEITPAMVVAEPTPAVNFDVAFSQPLKQFRQNRAIPRTELLDLLAELLGAPIRYDAAQLGAAAQTLDQKLSLDLSDTTVGKVLDKVLEKTGLGYDRERDGLRLLPIDDAAAAEKNRL